MKFYLCHTPEGRKRLLTRQDEAKKLDKNAEPIDIPVDQAGIKQAFEELFDQIYDLEQAAHIEISGSPEPEIHLHSHDTRHLSEDYAHRSTRFEDEFDKMPLAQQLHYASLATENARRQLPSVVPGTPVSEGHTHETR